MTLVVRDRPVLPRAPALRVRAAVDATGTVTYRVVGDLDATCVERFRTATASAPRQPRVVLDLTGVGFIDAAGLGAVTRLIRRVVDAGRPAAVATTSATITRLLDAAGVSEAAPIVASARDAFRRAPAVLPDDGGGFPDAPCRL
ncbi:MAG TPA: STAS domain-containing protein [Acidimicrobiales bacterium]|nr:STAS domain-containing protein [Acidimicrobiales bacterium]